MIFFDAVAVGDTFDTSSRTILDADIVAFAGLSGDFNRLHVDEEFAKTTPYGRRIAHGMLVASVVSGLRSRFDDYALLGFLESNRKFPRPVFPGDTITAHYAVTETRASRSNPAQGVVTFAVQVTNQRGVVVQEGTDIVMMERTVA